MNKYELIFDKIKYKTKNFISRILKNKNKHSSVIFGNGELKNIKPFSESSGKHIMNRACRLIYTAEHENRKVKIFEAENSDHAIFIKSVSNHYVIKNHLPGVYFTSGPFLFAEWIYGKSVSNFSPDEIVQLLIKFHKAELTELPEKSFDYWFDYLRPRFLKASHLVGRINEAADIDRMVSEYWNQGEPVLSHPDLTRDNIIRHENDSLVSIDNEFLSIGRLPLLDFCNTLKLFSPKEKEVAVQVWKDQCAPTDTTELKVVSGAWLARNIGTLLVTGKLKNIPKLFDIYSDNYLDILPAKFL